MEKKSSQIRLQENKQSKSPSTSIYETGDLSDKDDDKIATGNSTESKRVFPRKRTKVVESSSESGDDGSKQKFSENMENQSPSTTNSFAIHRFNEENEYPLNSNTQNVSTEKHSTEANCSSPTYEDKENVDSKQDKQVNAEKRSHLPLSPVVRIAKPIEPQISPLTPVYTKRRRLPSASSIGNELEDKLSDHEATITSRSTPKQQNRGHSRSGGFLGRKKNPVQTPKTPILPRETPTIPRRESRKRLCKDNERIRGHDDRESNTDESENSDPEGEFRNIFEENYNSDDNEGACINDSLFIK